MIAPNSRYASVGTKNLTRSDGTIVVYLARRFVPQPDSLQLIRLHTVTVGERLDLIANEEIGDPGMWWQLADANRAMWPEDLIVIGRQLRVTYPQGVPGAPGA